MAKACPPVYLTTLSVKVCRDVTKQRQPFPSFCPEDFAAASAAAKTALQLAQKAVARDPNSRVGKQSRICTSDLLRSTFVRPFCSQLCASTWMLLQYCGTNADAATW